MKILPCPHCDFFNLTVHARLELPATDGADETTLFAVSCPTSCASAFFGVSREVHIPEDSIDSFAFEVKDKKSWRTLLKYFTLCKTPMDKNCICRAHALFRHALGTKTYALRGVRLSDMPVALVWKDKSEFSHLDVEIPPYWP